MKKIFTPFVLIFVTAIVSSCVKDSSSIITYDGKFDFDSVNNLISEYNKELQVVYDEMIPPLRKGFLVDGALEASYLPEVENGIFTLVLLLQENSKKKSKEKLMFDVGLKKAIEFPSKINNAEIFFIGNQLVINNLDNNNQINFYVKSRADTVNKTPSISTINAHFLGIQKTEEENVEKAVHKFCSCTCIKCDGEGEYATHCGGESCSCMSGCGGGCSRTCSDGFYVHSGCLFFHPDFVLATVVLRKGCYTGRLIN